MHLWLYCTNLLRNPYFLVSKQTKGFAAGEVLAPFCMALTCFRMHDSVRLRIVHEPFFWLHHEHARQVELAIAKPLPLTHSVVCSSTTHQTGWYLMVAVTAPWQHSIFDLKAWAWEPDDVSGNPHDINVDPPQCRPPPAAAPHQPAM